MSAVVQPIQQAVAILEGRVEVGEIQKIGRPTKPCRHCGYSYCAKTCMCGGKCGGEGPRTGPEPYCPQCGCPVELPMNAEAR